MGAWDDFKAKAPFAATATAQWVIKPDRADQRQMAVSMAAWGALAFAMNWMGGKALLSAGRQGPSFATRIAAAAVPLVGAAATQQLALKAFDRYTDEPEPTWTAGRSFLWAITLGHYQPSA